jgi:hypothetical protein
MAGQTRASSIRTRRPASSSFSQLPSKRRYPDTPASTRQATLPFANPTSNETLASTPYLTTQNTPAGSDEDDNTESNKGELDTQILAKERVVFDINQDLL